MNYTELDILNFVDGRLDDNQTAEFLVTLRTDPELAQAVADMQGSHLPIREAYEQYSHAPVPDSLRTFVNELETNEIDDQQNSGQVKSNTRFGLATGLGLAACLGIGTVIGAMLSNVYLQRDTIGSNVSVTSVASGSLENEHDRLVKRVADYQSLYVENTVASLSNTRIEDAQALLSSASQRMPSQVSLLDFSSYGYEFARAQELGFEGQMLVQLVYRKPGSAPLAFCFMPSTGKSSQDLILSRHNQLHAASWITNGQHFVVVADENNSRLQELYKHTLMQW